MKQLTLLAFLLTSISAVHANNILDQSYVSAKLGASILDVKDVDSHYTENSTAFGTLKDSARFDSKDKTVFTGSIAYGIDLEKQLSFPIRAELEYTYRDNAEIKNLTTPKWTTKTDLDLKAQNLFLNFYYDFKNTSAFTPYVSAGLGMSHNKLKYTERFVTGLVTKANDSKNDFAWNVGLGLNYTINNNFDVDLGYRYVDLGKVSSTYKMNNVNFDYNSKIETKLRTQDITLGLRYKF